MHDKFYNPLLMPELICNLNKCALYTHLSLGSSNPCNKIGRENVLYINAEFLKINTTATPSGSDRHERFMIKRVEESFCLEHVFMINFHVGVLKKLK